MKNEDILQRCLEDVAAGRKTPAAWAEQFPQVPDLLGQLLAAQAFMDWPAPTVAPAAARRHQAQLRAALAANQKRSRRPALALLPRWALAATLVVALILGGAGAVSAAAGSLPGQALYPVKRAAEAFQAALIPATRQAAWQAGLAEARTGELLALAEQGATDPALLARLAAEISAAMETALTNVAYAPSQEQAALLVEILAQIEREQTVLALVRDAVPQQAQFSLDHALTVSQAQREGALDQLNTVTNQPGHPSPGVPASRTPTLAVTDIPPGQAKKTATATATPRAEAPGLPPGQAQKTATATPQVDDTHLPPGEAGHTATTAAQATAGITPTPPGNSGGKGQGPQSTPNCNTNNPSSPNYCTPTPEPSSGGASGGEQTAATEAPPPTEPTATACPLNPAGNPVCGHRP